MLEHLVVGLCDGSSSTLLVSALPLHFMFLLVAVAQLKPGLGQLHMGFLSASRAGMDIAEGGGS